MSSKEDRDVTFLTTVRLLATGDILELTMSHVPAILKLMNEKRDKTIVQNGCGAIFYIIHKNHANAKTIGKMGGVKVILDALKRHKANADVQEWGCGALQNLTLNDDNKKTIAKLGGIKVILDAMKRHESNADVQGRVCAVLTNLAANDADKKRIAKMGCIKVIFDAMKRHCRI